MTHADERPLILCYDGSDDAKHAIECAGELLTGRHTRVLSVWQSAAVTGSFAWSGVMAGTVDFAELDRAALDVNARIVEEGVRIARHAGFQAEALAAQATGPVWHTIVDVAESHDAAVIVMGSRGLTGLRSTLMGSVSSAVAHHTDRPTLIVHHRKATPPAAVQ